jgi:hypothetical protein
VVPIGVEHDQEPAAGVTLLQAYYTSCREGLGAGSGFQFSAASKDIDQPRLLELERHVLYAPPRSAPLEPTAAEIAAMPVKFQYRELYGGGFAVLRSVYLGRDYSNRFGNFFTHAVLVGQADDLDGALPVDLWAAPFWASGGNGRRELPAVRLEGRPPDELAAALNTLREPSRAPHVARFVDGVVRALDDGGRTVVVDSHDAARAWIEVASRVLPVAMAMRLTFTSFEPEPRQSDVHVCVTTPDSEVSFALYELRSGVTLVDVTGASETAPEADEPPGLFGRLAAELVARGDADAIRSFDGETVSRLDGDLAGDDLGPALALHAAREGSLDRDEIEAALRFVASRPGSALRHAELAWLVTSLPVDARTATLFRECVEAAGARPDGATGAIIGEFGLRWLLANPGIASAALPPGWRSPFALGDAEARAWRDSLSRAQGDEFMAALRLGIALGLADDGTLNRVMGKFAEIVMREPGAPVLPDAAMSLPPAPQQALIGEIARALGGDREAASGVRTFLVEAGLIDPLKRLTAEQADFRGRLELLALTLECTNPPKRPALEFLLVKAADEHDVFEAVHMVYGDAAPRTTGEALELIDAIGDHPFPEMLSDHITDAMARSAHLDDPSDDELELANKLAVRLASPPAFVIALRLVAAAPVTDRPMHEWVSRLATLSERGGLRAEERAAVTAIVVRRIVAMRDLNQLERLLADPAAVTEGMLAPLGRAVEKELDRGNERTAATMWEVAVANRCPVPELRITVERALDGWKEKQRRKVAGHLPAELLPEWDKWNEKHPPPTSTIGRLFGRSGER